MRRLWFAVGMVALLGVLVWANLNQTRQTAAEAARVRTVRLARKDLQSTVLAPATLDVSSEVEVRARVASPTVRLKVKEGDRVTAGQPLAELDDTELAAAVLQAESSLAQAEANLAQTRRQMELQPEQLQERLAAAELQVRQAEAALAAARAAAGQEAKAAQGRLAEALANLENAQARLAAGQATASEVQAALKAVETARADLAATDPATAPAVHEAVLRLEQALLGLRSAELEARAQAVLPEQLAAAEAAVLAAQGALAEARDRLAHAVVRAPVAGTVLEVAVKEGQSVTPGTLIAVIGDTDTLVAEVRVDEIEVAKVQPGQAVTLTTPAFPGETFAGRVVRIYPRGERPPGGTATVYRVRVEVQDRSGRLRPGMGVDAEITVSVRTGVLAVPSEAVVEEGGKRYVWIASDGRAVQREVQLGLATGTEVEVTEGLAEGDEVIVGPLSLLGSLREGQPVRPEPAGSQEGSRP